MTDHDLATLFAAFLRDGDERALEQLLRRSAPPLRALARRLGADADETEDLVQETVVAAIDAAERYDGTRPFLPWLKGILTFRAAKLARGRWRRRRVYGELPDPATAADPHAASPAAVAAHHELAADVAAAIERLPAAYQAPLRQFLLRGASPQAIAHELGEPRATVRVRLHRGLQQLRHLLTRWSGALLALLWLRPARAATPATASGRRLAGPLVGAAAAVAIAVGVAIAARNPSTDLADPATPSGTAAVPAITSAGPDLVPAAARERLAAPAPPRVVHVVDGHGVPVPGVGLTVAPDDGSDPVLHRRRTTSDARGVAVLPPLPDGRWRATADRGGSVDLASTSSPTVLTVPVAAPVHGRVVDADGAPVAGACVWLASDRDGPWRGADVAATDATGAFTLHAVPAGAVLAARHAVLARSEPVAVVDGTAPTLQLGPPGGTARVVVQDPDGAPCADALVFVGDAADASALVLADGASPWRAPPFEGRTGADGVFTCGALAPGRLPVFVRRAGCVPFAGHVDVGAGRDTTLRVHLVRGAVLHGEAHDAAGRPLAGAQVVLRTGDPAHATDLRSDAAGAFRFDCVPPGLVDVAARAPGHTPVVRTVVVAAATTLRTTLELAPTPVRRGILRRRDGGPLAGSAVRAEAPPSALHDAPTYAAVAADGSFALPLAAAAQQALTVRLPGDVLWRRADAFVRDDGSTLHVELPAGFAATSALAGTLTAADGTPLAGMRLFVHPEGEAWAELGRSDADGRFTLGPLPEGRCTLFAETRDPALPTVPCGVFPLVAGERTDVKVTAPAHGFVAVTFTRRDGAALGDFAATLVDVASGRRCALTTNTPWRQALLPGDYTLHVMGGHVRWRENLPVHVAADATTSLTVELEPAARATISLLGLPDDGAGLRVALQQRGSDWRVDFTLLPDAPRRLAAMLVPGDYELAATAADGTRWRGQFASRDADTPSHVAVQLAPAGGERPAGPVPASR